jgi:hypothetical protein
MVAVTPLLEVWFFKSVFFKSFVETSCKIDALALAFVEAVYGWSD